jgi:hypothetical protein
MKRRSIVSLVFVVVVALALASPVWAGGVIVTLDTTPTDVQAGVPFDVDFTVISAHDGSDIVALKPIVTATNSATGEEITVTATGDWKTGHYIARLTLPSAGEWQWGIQPFGAEAPDDPLRTMTPLQVSAPGTQPIVETDTPRANAIAFDAALPVIALLAVTASIATLALIRVRRRALIRS